MQRHCFLGASVYMCFHQFHSIGFDHFTFVLRVLDDETIFFPLFRLMEHFFEKIFDSHVSSGNRIAIFEVSFLPCFCSLCLELASTCSASSIRHGGNVGNRT